MWIETFGAIAVGRGQRGGDQAARSAAERDGGDFLDARQRDQHQRDQQHEAEPEREGGAEHEIVASARRRTRSRTRRRPRWRAIASVHGLAERGMAARQDRQRQQQAEQDGEPGELPVVGIVDRPGPGELGVARRVEHAPIRADAAFVGLPRLVEGFDDVVVDAEGLGARDEVAQHGRLLDAAGLALEQVVAGARPAEFGDHDALARVMRAQLL